MTRSIAAFIFPHIMAAWSPAERDRNFRSLKDWGVNTISTESEAYSRELIDLAHSLDMRFVGGISCFSEHGRANKPLEERPELHPILETGERRPLMEWYIGVTPTFDDYNTAQLDRLDRIMRDHELDGMWLDFIRWPLHWELELRPGEPEPLQSSFDPHTVSRFLEQANLELPADTKTIPQQARWILDHHRDQWTDFKCATLATFVAQARERVKTRRPQADFGLYLVPAPDDQRAYWVGQRVRDLSPHVDYLSPMAYHPILHQNPAWVSEVIDDIVKLAPGKILPVLQVDSAEGEAFGADFGPPVPVGEWRELACAVAKRDDTEGLAAFTGTALFADHRGAILGECLSEKRS